MYANDGFDGFYKNDHKGVALLRRYFIFSQLIWDAKVGEGCKISSKFTYNSGTAIKVHAYHFSPLETNITAALNPFTPRIQ